jgi:phospho-N-acetylmuramoyl-pentapeptide-transferase
MLHFFLFPLREYFFPFNIFRYVTVRAAGASVTAFLVCLILGPMVIRWLTSISAVGSTEREHASQIHNLYQHKKSVPTMGGILIVISVLISSVLWGNLENRYVWICMIVMTGFGAVGFLDDYLKVREKNTKGISSKTKLAGQLIIGILMGWYLWEDPNFIKFIFVPFVKNFYIPLGVMVIPFVVLVLVGSSNALNLTDGLDGLAIGCSLFVTTFFAIMAYVSGHFFFSDYLGIPFIRQSAELAVFCAALLGAGMGFLWYNSYPATVFMGDTGSLSIGGAIGAIAVLTKKELLLVIVGGIFVLEAMSVILQVLSFKLRKKRIFLMSPFHHHLQLKGWSESKITIRFWIISFILCLIGFSALKLI